MSAPVPTGAEPDEGRVRPVPGLPEGLVLVLLTAMALVEAARGAVVLAHGRAGAGALAGAALLAAATVCLAVPALRARPVLALAPALLAPLVAAAAGWDPIVEWSATSFVAFVLSAGPLPWWFMGPTSAVAGVLAVRLAARTVAPSATAATDIPSTIVAALSPCMAALLGEALRSQRARALETERRHRQALATRRARTERAVAQERLRIARDLHDGVGHRVAVLSMRLGAAEVHAATDPDALAQDLAAARETVQQILAETQSILRLLRRTDGAPASAVEPVASHERVPDLVDEARDAGALVEADLIGLDRPLPAQTSAAVYRIVQEALTNALRHGRGTVRLAVAINDDGARITVANRVRPAAAGRGGRGTGFGLTGACERAASVGGAVTTSVRGAGARREFVLTAELPPPASPASPAGPSPVSPTSTKEPL